MLRCFKLIDKEILTFHPDIWQIRSFAHWKSCKSLEARDCTSHYHYLTLYDKYPSLFRSKKVLKSKYQIIPLLVIFWLLKFTEYEFIFLEFRESSCIMCLLEDLNIAHGVKDGG